MSRLMGIAVLLSVIVTDRTASAETVQDFRTWINLTLQGRVGTAPWRWHVDVQERNRNGVEEIDQFLVRPAVGYALSQRSSVWAGYAYVASFQAGGGVSDEHRTWQQYLWSGPAAGGTLSARSRLEQRFLEGVPGATWRVRQLIRFQYPLRDDGSVAAILWDEIFLQLHSNARAPGGLDQNRGFSGISIRASPKARFEVGYMNQFIQGVSQDRMNHVLSGVVTITFSP